MIATMRGSSQKPMEALFPFDFFGMRPCVNSPAQIAIRTEKFTGSASGRRQFFVFSPLLHRDGKETILTSKVICNRRHSTSTSRNMAYFELSKCGAAFPIEFSCEHRLRERRIPSKRNRRNRRDILAAVGAQSVAHSPASDPMK